MGSSNEPGRSARREPQPAIRRLPSDRGNRRSKNHLYWLRGPVSCRGPVVAGPGALRGGRSWWSGKSQASRGRESRLSQLCLNPGADHRRASRHCEQPLHSGGAELMHSTPLRGGEARRDLMVLRRANTLATVCSVVASLTLYQANQCQQVTLQNNLQGLLKGPTV